MSVEFFILLMIALPTMIASAPALIINFAWEGLLIPKPTATGILDCEIFLTLLMVSNVYLSTDRRTPVIPYIDTKYKKPEDLFIIEFSLMQEVLGEARKIVESPNFEAVSTYDPDSSTVMSGKIKPSIPRSFALVMKLRKPLRSKIFEYVIAIIGTVGCFPRIFLTIVKHFSGVTPFRRA